MSADIFLVVLGVVHIHGIGRIEPSMVRASTGDQKVAGSIPVWGSETFDSLPRMIEYIFLSDEYIFFQLNIYDYNNYIYVCMYVLSNTETHL